MKKITARAERSPAVTASKRLYLYMIQHDDLLMSGYYDLERPKHFNSYLLSRHSQGSVSRR